MSAKEKAAKKAAKQAHDNTSHLPSRQSSFNVPNGPTYSGYDVRKSVYDAHVEDQHNQSKSKTQKKKSAYKEFKNFDNQVPHGSHDVQPLPHMHGYGYEYPIGDPHNKGPGRVITQPSSSGHHFMGVVSHDPSRQSGYGYNDHFQVPRVSPPRSPSPQYPGSPSDWYHHY